MVPNVLVMFLIETAGVLLSCKIIPPFEELIIRFLLKHGRSRLHETGHVIDSYAVVRYLTDRLTEVSIEQVDAIDVDVEVRSRSVL